MYEEPKLGVLLFPQEDVIRTSPGLDFSGETDWEDDNVDVGGWT